MTEDKKFPDICDIAELDCYYGIPHIENGDELSNLFIHKDDHKKLESLGWVRKDVLKKDIEQIIYQLSNSGNRVLIPDMILKLLGDEDEGK